jgi:hypothetical protein
MRSAFPESDPSAPSKLPEYCARHENDYLSINIVHRCAFISSWLLAACAVDRHGNGLATDLF